MTVKVRVGDRSELESGGFLAATVEGKRIVVFDVEGTLHATSAVCAHQGGPLDLGLFEGTAVTCPWHAWQFDVRTGEAVYDPGHCIATYPVEVVENEILVLVEVSP
jgi:3-phenylpropionate/trans-cinnamate dioxygenase ferredoxin component